MKQHIIKAFLTKVLLVITFPSYGQDTLQLSLLDAWKRAEVHSRSVHIASIAKQIAEQEIKDAQVERLPEIGVIASAEKASNIPIYENGLFSKPSQHEVIHTLYKAGTDFYLNLYNGNKLNLKISENKVLYQITKINENESLSVIRFKTAEVYLDLQRNFIFRTLILNDIADQEKQLREIKAFYKHGTVLKSDVLRIELELSKRKMALVTIDNDIQIASQKLNIIMGTPDETVIVTDQIKLPTSSPESYEQLLQDAFEHSFPYHRSEQLTELSKVHLNQIRANVRPKVGLYSEFYYANPQIFLFPYNPSWYSLGVAGIKASFSISSLYHNIHKVQAARLEFDKEEEMHKDIEDKLRQQVKEAYLKYREALLQINVSEADVAQAEENARIIKNAYFNNTSLITDLLDADIQVLETRFGLATAKITAQTKYYLLQNITGVL